MSQSQAINLLNHAGGPLSPNGGGFSGGAALEQMGFEFIENIFDFPALSIKRRQR